MFVTKSALVSIGLSSLVATSLARPQSASQSFADYPADRALSDIYGGGAISFVDGKPVVTLNPAHKALNESIGSCKFTIRRDANLPMLLPTGRAEPLLGGKPSGFLFTRASRKSNDTCLYFRGKYILFI